MFVFTTADRGYFTIKHDASMDGLPYDYWSISRPQALRAGRVVYTPLKNMGIKHNLFFSEYDYLHINLAYCEGEKIIFVCIDGETILKFLS